MKAKFLSRFVLVALMAGVVAGLTGCNTVPITGRSQFTALVSPSQEIQLGLTSFEELKKTTPISQDAAANALVQKVGKRIAAVAGPDMPNAQWEFVVFESKEANAFCLPGGKVGVYTGILPVTKDEAGMATVIGHEVAHAVARHGAERMTEQLLIQFGGEGLGALMEKSDPKLVSVANAVYGVGSTTLVALPHSRSQESEADHIGLVYMARAGYNPETAVQFWQRFAQFNTQNGGNSTPTFLRTHPTDETRIQQLQQWMPEAKAQYKPQ
jgi:predicted Zn-dependent protease